MFNRLLSHGVIAGCLWCGWLMIASVNPVRAAEPLAGCDLSRPIWGNVDDAKHLAGKVIFFEYWGIWCPPCRASLPGLDALQKQFGPTGKFQVIASHHGNQSDAVAFCKKLNLHFPVYQDLVPATAPKPRAWPKAYLFDHTGKLVGEGHPVQLKHQVKALVDAAPAPAQPRPNTPASILGDMKVQHCQTQAKMLIVGRPVRPAMTALQRFVEQGGDKADEARQIIAAVNHWLDERLGRARELTDTQPTVALEMYNQLVPMLSGMNRQKQVFELRQPLAANKDVRTLMRHRRAIQRSLDQLADPHYAKSARQALQTLAHRLTTMLNYPNLTANVKAEVRHLLARIQQATGQPDATAPVSADRPTRS